MMRRRRPLILASVVALAAFSLVAAGCGGGTSPGVANVASSTTATTTTQNGLVAYSRCMRSNGVPNFPDPQRVGGRSLKLTIQRLVTAPKFGPAQRACGHLLPDRGTWPQESAQQTRIKLADELSFAR
jgi:hypothetical protein